MSKALKVLAISLFLVPTISFADELTRDAQSLLNNLGYNAGSVDGIWGKKTRAALEKFFKDNGKVFDGSLGETEILILTNALKTGQKAKPAVSGIEIKNSHDYSLFPHHEPGAVKNRYWWVPSYEYHDFNNDGILDVLYNGNMIPDNKAPKGAGNTIGHACGSAWEATDRCIGKKFGPSFFLGTKDGKFQDHSHLFVDKRKDPGQQLVSKELVADFNNDGVLDYWVIDTGMGTWHGWTDSYFLSNPDGKWYESSYTHLSDPQYSVFNHGGTFGDIDGDGDLDIVMTQQTKNGKPQLTCWMNDGSGFMTVRKCGDVHAFAVELGDMDGDGDLDVVHGGNEYEAWTTRTGIMYNDGNGNFGKSKRLPQDGTTKWGTVSEISMWDLDDDGDLDIAVSRAGYLYVGVAIDILENKGNGKFSSQMIKIIEAPDSYVPVHEGNEWNYHAARIRFNDVDSDGDKDIVMVTHRVNDKLGSKMKGAIIQNNGNMNLKYLKNSHPENPIKFIPEQSYIFYGKDAGSTGKTEEVLGVEALRRKLKKK